MQSELGASIKRAAVQNFKQGWRLHIHHGKAIAWWSRGQDGRLDISYANADSVRIKFGGRYGTQIISIGKPRAVKPRVPKTNKENRGDANQKRVRTAKKTRAIREKVGREKPPMLKLIKPDPLETTVREWISTLRARSNGKHRALLEISPAYPDDHRITESEIERLIIAVLEGQGHAMSEPELISQAEKAADWIEMIRFEYVFAGMLMDGKLCVLFDEEGPLFGTIEAGKAGKLIPRDRNTAEESKLQHPVEHPVAISR